jgi:NFU1 iron-sulfur cluster scaffold homolog, mitochondrial
MMDAATELKVTGEFLPDPNMCRFEVNQPVWTGERALVFTRPDQSQGSPLIDALFAIEGITRVKVAGNTITLSKNIPNPWPELAKFILPAIRDPMSADAPVISEAAAAATAADDNVDIADAVEELLQTHINPALASHGGFVRLVKVENGDVHIEMGGGCQGCAASKMTMKNGVEAAIREICPQVNEIIDVTDHAAGTNPYYR